MAIDHQAQVRSFMEVMNQLSDKIDYPHIPKLKTQKLRAELILEEAHEFINCVFDPANLPLTTEHVNAKLDALVPIADSFADLLYVVYGACIAYGINIHPIFQIVHEANMTKFNGPVREDGKRLKSPDWVSPDAAIRTELQRQIEQKLHPTAYYDPMKDGLN